MGKTTKQENQASVFRTSPCRGAGAIPFLPHHQLYAEQLLGARRTYISLFRGESASSFLTQVVGGECRVHPDGEGAHHWSCSPPTLRLGLWNFFFFAVTRVCTQGLMLARKAPFHLAMPPAFYPLVIFETESLVFAWVDLDLNPPIYASCIAGMTGMHHHTQFWG
jgi:hypothetical protein